MVDMLANSMVILGACVLLGSLLPVSKLIAQLPSGQVRRCWLELTVLIAILIVGYVAYSITFWDRHSGYLDFIVPGIFLFCAIFVWLTTTLTQQTAFDVRRVALLEQESITDPLTGVYNRRYLDRRLEEEINRAKRYDLPLSILLIDIDHFKQVNDTYGHQVGDSLLIDLSKMILSHIRTSDVAARYGGDELLILAQNATLASATTLGERLRENVEQNQPGFASNPDEKQNFRITVSIGIAGLGPDITDAEGLVKYADEALYRAKQEGRNCVITHDLNAAEVASP